jgi:hypothetical protein
MIVIKKSLIAGCDFSKVSKRQLRDNSCQHISDVREGLQFFGELLKSAAAVHDSDELSTLDRFHSDFITSFRERGWWDNHCMVTRHHLHAENGVPEDVNLIDVIETVVDSVMSCIARTGSVYPFEIKPEVLMRAVQNTIDLLKSQIQVEMGRGDRP